MKKAIIWVLFFVICFLSGALLSYHAPKVEAWLILLIERESSKSGVAGVLPTHLTVGLFPPVGVGGLKKEPHQAVHHVVAGLIKHDVPHERVAQGDQIP